jgi:two-component system, OmpR family, sensor histidine kinase CpxA
MTLGVRGLFAKIFLWFLGGSALVVVAAAVATLATPTGPGSPLWSDAVGTDLASHADRAVEIYRRDGPEALDRYLCSLGTTAGACVCLFDASGMVVAGPEAPPRARHLAELSGKSDQAEFQLTGSTLLGAHTTVGSDGNRYTLVMEVPGGALEAIRRTPGAYAIRFAVALAAAAVVCVLLARSLTGPILSLRAATQRAAAGDLSVRVGAGLGGRRDELADLGRDFDAMAERLELLLASERRLLSDISHELRSPLARLGVALGIARRKAGGEARPALNRIERETVRIDEMIDHLLELARMEHDGAASARSSVDLARLVETVAQDADFEARDVGRSVRLVAADSCSVLGDERALRSAVENVVRNAIRYTPEGGTADVALRMTNGGRPRAAEVRVRDHGPGVPEETLPHLFRPFYRVGDARDRDSGGVGLGLAIAERAVARHGGHVRATNAADGGLVVTLRLPLDENGTA